MREERFLVTGALGCIGAWVVRKLVQEGIETHVFDLASDSRRLHLIMDDEEYAKVNFRTGDISNFNEVERCIIETGATHMIHLAALQVPFCREDPVRGAQVNVLGTVNVFEGARRAGLHRVTYASSIAVYGLSEDYADEAIGPEAPLKPRNLYGIYKQANEGTARVYWLENGISSIGLRPYIVYGPGRDQGLTSGPTKAMLAAARGEGYHIPFGGYSTYQYVEDVAEAFIRAARVSSEGAEVFNMGGSLVHVRDIIKATELAEPPMIGRVTFDDKPLPFPEKYDDSLLHAVLGSFQETPLQTGVEKTIALFKQAINQNRI